MIAIEHRQVIAIARKEFRDRMRSRWVLAVTAILAVFALVIAYFGAAQQGAVGFKGMDLTIASLVSLVIYLVPLISLLLGYDAIVGERERGSLDLLLAMPLTRLELLLGKFLGLATALGFAIGGGFGLAGIALSYGVGLDGLVHYLGFMLNTFLMGLAFLSIALLISAHAPNKVAASGGAVVLWFLFVLVYDLILLGILVASGGQIVGDVFPWLLLLNPADVFRILTVFSLEEVRTFYGLATVVPDTLSNPWLLGLAMLVWIAAPLAAAYYRFCR